MQFFKNLFKDKKQKILTELRFESVFEFFVFWDLINLIKKCIISRSCNNLKKLWILINKYEKDLCCFTVGIYRKLLCLC